MPGRGNAAGGSGVSSTFGCIPTGVQLTMTSAMMVARCDQVTIRQPTSSASAVARSSCRLVIVKWAPRLIRPKAIDRATPPAPRISTCLSISGLAASSLGIAVPPPMAVSRASMAAR